MLALPVSRRSQGAIHILERHRLAIIGTMAVASFTAHRGRGAFLATGGPELTLINLTAAAVLATAAPGAYSADRLLRLRITPLPWCASPFSA
jgi:hypothetical protein